MAFNDFYLRPETELNLDSSKISFDSSNFENALQFSVFVLMIVFQMRTASFLTPTGLGLWLLLAGDGDGSGVSPGDTETCRNLCPYLFHIWIVLQWKRKIYMYRGHDEYIQMQGHTNRHVKSGIRWKCNQYTAYIIYWQIYTWSSLDLIKNRWNFDILAPPTFLKFKQTSGISIIRSFRL